MELSGNVQKSRQTVKRITAGSRAELKNYLRRFTFVRVCARFVRRVRKWHQIIPAYVKKLGLLNGLRVLVLTSVSPSTVRVSLPGVREPLLIRPRTSDKFVFEQIFIEDEYDINTDLHPQFIVDAGANVGYASIYFSSRWPEAKIIAIEPDPENFAALQKNLAAYPAVHAIQAALWPRNELLSLETGWESWSSRVGSLNVSEAQKVSGITLDQVLANAGENEIDLLKLDVEGAERELFGSPGHWLERTKIIVTELHDRIIPGCTEALDRAIEKMDFSRSVLGENIVLVRGA
jgi:FkbM family methyltransferase